MNKIFKFFENGIIKNIFSIILALFLIFDVIAPQLIINAYSHQIESKKNYSQRDYMPEKFSFDLPGYGPLYRIEVDMDSPKFNPIKVPKYNPQFLVGIVNVDYDTDSISKEIGKDVFLGMEKYEIINNIKNKHKGRIWKYKGKDVYNYSANGQNAIINLDSMIVDRRAKGGIAVILEVLNLPMMNETPIHDVFILKSICINDNSENLGIIRINDEDFILPNSIKLLKNKEYRIKYVPIEGYEFDHWEVHGGKLVYQSNSSRNTLFIQNDYGEIIAYYKKIGISSTSTITSIISISSKLTTSSPKTTQQISTKSTYTTSIKTQSTTSNKEETKIKTTITISQYTLTYSISKSTIETYKVIKGDEYKAKYESYNTYTSINTISKTTYNTTSTIKKDKNIFDTIGDTISNIGKSILEGTKDIIDKTINVVNDFVKKALDFINNINPFKGNTTITSSTTTPIKTSISIKITASSLITSSTSSINTKTSNTITTIFNYKYITTKTITTTSVTPSIISIKTTSSFKITTTSISYDIDKHIINNLNYYNSVNNVIKTTNTIYYTVKGSFVTYTTALYTYTTTKKITSSIKNSNTISGGGGSPKALLRDSLLFNEEIYKEFLKKIENKKELPLLYLVYKITPLRVEQCKYYKDMIVYEIHPIIKNYDNEGKLFILSLGERGRKYDGFFLIKPNVYEGFNLYSLFHEINKEKIEKYGFDFRREIPIYIEGNGKFDKPLKIFFVERENSLSSSLGEKYHSLNFYLYTFDDKLIDAEPDFQSGVELSLFGETMVAFMTAVCSAINSFASTGILLIFQKIFPPTLIYYVTAGTQLWSDYFAYKKISQEDLLNEAKSEAIIKTYEFIDIYSKNKEIAKKEVTDYFYGFLMSIESIIDPINLGAGIVTGDLRNTLPGHMYSLLEDSLNPNLEMRERADKIGEFIGITTAFAYVFNLHKKIPKKLLELIEGKGKIIEKELNKIWIESKEVASETLKLLDKISEKFEDVGDEALSFIDTIKKLLDLKHKLKDKLNENDIADVIRKIINEIDDIKSKKGLEDLKENLIEDVIVNKLKAIEGKIYKETLEDGTIKYLMQINAREFENIVGKVPIGSYGVFIGITEDGSIIYFIREIGEADRGTLHFGATMIYEKLKTNKIYVILEKTITTSNEFFDFFKGKIKEGIENLNDISFDGTKLKLILSSGGNTKVINIEDIELHYVTVEGLLGLKGKLKIRYEKDGIEIYKEDREIGIYTDGDNIVMKIKKGEYRRKIESITISKNKIMIKYYTGEYDYVNGNEAIPKTATYTIFLNLEGEPQYNKIGEKIYRWFLNEEEVELYNLLEDTTAKGKLGQVWAKYIAYKFLKEVLGYDVKSIEIIGVTGTEDLKIIIKDLGEIPGEVKAFKYFSEDRRNPSKLKGDFMYKLTNKEKNGAMDQILKDFDRDAYSKSPFGIAVIIGVVKDYNINDATIEVDVLIVKVYRDETYDVLCKPSWWQD